MHCRVENTLDEEFSTFYNFSEMKNVLIDFSFSRGREQKFSTMTQKSRIAEVGFIGPTPGGLPPTC